MNIFASKNNIMRKIIFILISFCTLWNLLSCSYSKKQKTTQSKTTNLTYAQGFSIDKEKDFTCVTVYNPWKKGEIFARYYLVKSNEIRTPKDGAKIKIPIQSMVANSATYFTFLEELGELNVVKGVCNTNYIYNPSILKGVETKKIVDLGDAFNNDMETLLLLQPEIMMTTAYNAVDENSKRLAKTGIHLIYNIEWQERKVLGRAEWIKFVAAFFDKGALADSLFKATEKRYLRLKAIASKAQSKPSIMSGQDFRGSWTMPAGISFSNELFNDANISYIYSKNTDKGSISSTIEEVLMKFHNADIWIGVSALDYQQLKDMNEKYALFKAFKNKQVYNFKKRCTSTGGSDYWESGVAHPDYILADLIKICHPELLPDYTTFYTSPLK